jgi:general nucleoside transport system permease protein
MKPNFRIVRSPAPGWFSALIPLLAIVVTFMITSVFIIIAGANPFEAYYYFLISPLTSKVGILEVLVKSTPLLLTGAAVTIAFASGYWNIGAEGQLYSGAVAAAWLGTALIGVPQPAAVLIMLVGGFIAGMLWALVPAILKVKLSVDEVVTTLLMNYVALFFVSALLNGPWRDPVSNWPQSPTILANTMMPKLLPPARLHFGFIIGILAVATVWFILSRTGLGLRMRSVGMGQEAARFMGVKVGRTMFITALISGGIAGLAGVTEVAGIHFHLIDAISPGYGYSGIIAATLGNLNPIGAGAASLFLGLISTGSQAVSRSLGVPSFLGDVVQSTLLLVTLAMFLLRNYTLRRVE